jgi:hypothetical protein
MTSQTASSPVKTPLHLWIVGGVSLLWNSFGAVDYLRTQLQVEAYRFQFSQEQLAYFYGFPGWANAFWALGVWGSVIGSLGLLVRKAWATWAFAVSIFGLVGTSLCTMVFTDGIAVMGGIGTLIFSVVIWIITIALFFYARRMSARGVLRG